MFQLLVVTASFTTPAAVAAEDMGYIGIAIKADEDKKGVEVVEALADAPADKAGVKSGDLITKLDGKGFDDVADFVQKVRDKKPGDTITLTVMRDGKEKEIKVKVGKKPEEE